MKEFRKNQDGHFICEECNLSFKNYKGLQLHIRWAHEGDYKKYFDKWLKTKNDGKCVMCNNNTRFKSIIKGYNKCCSSIKCINNYKTIRHKECIYEKYGVINNFQREDIKIKSKKTKLKKYNDGNYTNVEKQIKTKSKLFKEGKYKESISRRIQTNIKLYGVEHPYQNDKIFLMGQKTAFKIKKFKDTILSYQGSYELDFLEKFYDKIDIENGPSIPYLFEGKNKMYHSDFYIPSRNLVVEIKNSYLFTKDKKRIEIKEKATNLNGYNYIIIVDKDYSEFKKFC
jgi:hypothetical protein